MVIYLTPLVNSISEFIHCGLLAHSAYILGVLDWGRLDISADQPPQSLAVSLTISVLTDTILQVHLFHWHVLSISNGQTL